MRITATNEKSANELYIWRTYSGSYWAAVRLVGWIGQDQPTLTTRLYLKWQVGGDNYPAYWWDANPYTIALNGDVKISDSFALQQSSNEWVDRTSAKSIDIKHGSDGTYSGTLSITGYKYWEYFTQDIPIELPSISAVADVSAPDAPDVASWYRERVRNVYKSIKAQSKNWVNIAFVTDMHSDANQQHSQDIVLYLLRNSIADFAVLNGDFCKDGWNDGYYATYVNKLLNSDQKSKIFATVGNHDYGHASKIMSDFLIDKSVNSPNVLNGYYYFDDASKKIRYIFLNTSDSSWLSVGSDQISWLRQNVVLPNSDWDLVVFAHENFDDDGLSGLVINSGDSSMTCENGSDIKNALSNCTGNIVGYFCGHQHIDRSSVILTDNKQIHQNIILCDRFENNPYYNVSYPTRTIGTESEQVVTIISINVKTKQVVTKRIGAGSPLSYYYADGTTETDEDFSNVPKNGSGHVYIDDDDPRYYIYCDGQVLYGINDDEHVVLNPVLDLSINETDSFTFTLPPSNTLYSSISKLKSTIEVRQGDEVLFRGRVLDDNLDFNNLKHVHCEGALAYLQDTVMRPFAAKTYSTVKDYFKAILDEHCKQVPDSTPYRKLKFNKCDILTPLSEDFALEDYTQTSDEISSLLDTFGGYLKLEYYDDGTTGLSYVSSYNHTSSQVIDFGENLLDLNVTIDTSSIYTSVIALGKANEDTGVRLTTANIFTDNKDGISKFGRIIRVFTFDEIDNVNDLTAIAEAYAAQGLAASVTIDISAVDLHLVNPLIQKFRCGDAVYVRTTPHGIDGYYQCSKVSLDLQNPDNTNYSFGSQSTSLTSSIGRSSYGGGGGATVIYSGGSSGGGGGSGGGGSSGGTTNYNDLSNKPSVNSVTLIGNKTGEELSLINTTDTIEESTIDQIIYGGL